MDKGRDGEEKEVVGLKTGNHNFQHITQDSRLSFYRNGYLNVPIDTVEIQNFNEGGKDVIEPDRWGIEGGEDAFKHEPDWVKIDDWEDIKEFKVRVVVVQDVDL